MSKVVMEALMDIANCCASPSDTFIRMYSAENPLDVLPKFSLYMLIMQEVEYHISIGLTTRLHRKKKAPFPTLPPHIGL